MKLTREERDALRDVFRERPDSSCEECGGYHLRACRRVKKKEFHPNGNLISVEFWQDGQWDDSEVIWPEDVFDEAEE